MSKLVEVLERSRSAGFLGPGPLEPHLAHAQRYADALGTIGPLHVLDLGSGGGLPGLVVFTQRQDLTGCLLDVMLKRTAFLDWAVNELGLSDRVSVATGRAEDLAHSPAHRSAYDAVIARSFGPPAATVEAALGFLSANSKLIISEPPGGRAWPDLSGLNLNLVPPSESPDGTVVFRCTAVADATYPRPIRKQRREPLF